MAEGKITTIYSFLHHGGVCVSIPRGVDRMPHNKQFVSAFRLLPFVFQFGRKYSLKIFGMDLYCIFNYSRRFYEGSIPPGILCREIYLKGALYPMNIRPCRSAWKSSGTESESLPLPPHKQMLAAVSLSVSFRSSWSRVDSPESLLSHSPKREGLVLCKRLSAC